MADKEVAIKINVDADGGAKSLSELKKEFKETQKTLEGLTQGSKEYVNALSKIGAIKGEIGDLNDTFKAFNPDAKMKAFGSVASGMASGIQGAVGAMALFGVESEDTQKMLLKVQAASAFADGINGIMGMGDAFSNLKKILLANPIMLIATIVISIGAAMFALKDKVKIIGDAFDFVGKIIGIVVQGFKDLTDFMGLTSNASDDLAATQIANAKKTGDAIVSRYDREIERAAAAGKNTLDLEKKKQLAIIETLRLEAIAIVTAARARGGFTDEENKRFTELIALTQKAADAVVIIDIKKNKQIQDNNIKAGEDAKKLLDKELEESKARAAQSRKDIEELHNIKKGFSNLEEQDRLEKQAKADADNEAETQKILSRLASRNELIKFQNDQTYAGQLENLQIQMNAELKLVEDDEAAKFLIREKYAQKTKDLNLQIANASLDIAQQSNNAMQGLSDLFFSVKMANMEKGSAAELKAAKQQFKVNKALAITNGIISTIQGVINALTAQSSLPEPYATILRVVSAVSVAAAGAANVAKISAQQFNPGATSGGGGATASLGSAGGGVALEPPSSGSTQLNADGTIKSAIGNAQPTIKAVVVETDITTSQKRVNTIEERASL
jgi:small nuclear ribonucleoprotein (snRNP)-like protein